MMSVFIKHTRRSTTVRNHCMNRLVYDIIDQYAPFEKNILMNSVNYPIVLVTFY